MTKVVSPIDGGCWFCFTDTHSHDWVYDPGFKTYVHLGCLKEALERGDEEAMLMEYLVEMYD